MYYLVERHMGALRRRLHSAPKRPAQTATGPATADQLESVP
jgi:hypothetical protein